MTSQAECPQEPLSAPHRPPPDVTGEELIVMLAVTVEVACQRMTPSHLAALSASVGQAASLPARTSWERKAVAHAQTIGMLGDATGDLVLARAAGHAAGYAYVLALSAGPAADGIIRNGCLRLLGHMRTGDADAAGHEIEQTLRVLRFMARLARSRTR
jgi:hypothetical protein